MSIIVQCGHEMTVSEKLMGLLHNSGLKKPVNSTKSGFSASEITESLNKIYEKKLALINNKLAESLAVEFLLSNLDVDNWGWSNSKNLTSLHFWRSLDPDCKFILVFDHPYKIFEHAIDNDLSQLQLDIIVNDWIEYQRLLLDFYSDNKEACIILEGEAALDDLKNVKKSIKLIAPTLSLIDIKKNKHIKEKNNYAYEDGLLKEKLLNGLLNNYPEVLEIIRELREKASVKFNESSISKEVINAEDLYLLSKKVSKADRANSEKDIDKLRSRLNKSENYIKTLESSLNSNQVEYRKELDCINEKTSLQLKVDPNKLSIYEEDELEELKKENQILLKQIYLVQKELEYNWVKDTNKDNKKIEVPKKVEVSEKVEIPKMREVPKAIPFGVEQRIKIDLPYRIGASIIENSKSRKDVLNIPKAIAMEYIDYNKNLKYISGLPSIEEYGDFDKAEKIKQHLSYQIGEVVVESIKEPKKIIAVPIKIGNRVLSFKKAKFIQKIK